MSTALNSHENLQDDSNSTDVLRLPQVLQRTGLARSTIYRLMAGRNFPLPVRLAARAVGWRKADVDKWSAALKTVSH